VAGLLAILFGFFIIFMMKDMFFAPFGSVEATLMFGGR
jgi:hypothetical protein